MLGDPGIRRLATWVLAAALGSTLIWSPGCSESPPEEIDEGVREVYDLSHLPPQIAAAIDAVEGALQSQRARFTHDQFSVAERVAGEQFTAEKLEKRVLELLRDRADPGLLEETLDWLNEPRVQTVLRARSEIEEAANVADLRAFVDERQAHPPSKKRVALIERYDRATHLSRLSEETVLLTGYAVGVMADSLAPADERLGSSALQESVKTRRKLLEPFFKEISSVTSLYSFRSLSDDEVEGILTFCESEAGRWFFETTSSAYLDTLEEATNGLEPVFVAALGSNASP